MATSQPHSAAPALPPDIKQVPADPAVRALVRDRVEARRAAGELPDLTTREALETAGAALLAELGLPGEYLGFAMVVLDSAAWRERFARVPFDRRLLLLPHCLQDGAACPAPTDGAGLHCAGCGNCDIMSLQAEAEALGYRVTVAEGTGAVLLQILADEADALLGVACLDSLEKSFNRIADLGIPHQTVPLLADGCQDTEVEVDLLREVMATYTPAVEPDTAASYLPLMREAYGCFGAEMLDELLAPVAAPCFRMPTAGPALAATDEIAREWLQRGGKRLRPFLTLATYAVARHGAAATAPGADLAALVPAPVRSLAVAIECMHKASLAHDDIEDDDAYRYGKPTLHRTYGVPAAINVGDYLVGLGYRLIAGQGEALGAACVADILNQLSRAHLQLCCGQGGELLWPAAEASQLRPLHALQIAALKTAPAFLAALYTGLRAADADFDEDILLRFATHLGEGYQTLNDLENWSELEDNKVNLGRDVLMRRPTVLQALAREAGAGAEFDRLLADGSRDPEQTVSAVYALYWQCGALTTAAQLLGKLRERCLDLAARIGPGDLPDLFTFLVRNILRAAPTLAAPPTP